VIIVNGKGTPGFNCQRDMLTLFPPGTVILCGVNGAHDRAYTFSSRPSPTPRMASLFVVVPAASLGIPWCHGSALPCFCLNSSVIATVPRSFLPGFAVHRLEAVFLEFAQSLIPCRQVTHEVTRQFRPAAEWGYLRG
jgi:hypothetical protein